MSHKTLASYAGRIGSIVVGVAVALAMGNFLTENVFIMAIVVLISGFTIGLLTNALWKEFLGGLIGSAIWFFLGSQIQLNGFNMSFPFTFLFLAGWAGEFIDQLTSMFSEKMIRAAVTAEFNDWLGSEAFFVWLAEQGVQLPASTPAAPAVKDTPPVAPPPPAKKAETAHTDEKPAAPAADIPVDFPDKLDDILADFIPDEMLAAVVGYYPTYVRNQANPGYNLKQVFTKAAGIANESVTAFEDKSVRDPSQLEGTAAYLAKMGYSDKLLAMIEAYVKAVKANGKGLNKAAKSALVHAFEAAAASTIDWAAAVAPKSKAQQAQAQPA